MARLICRMESSLDSMIQIRVIYHPDLDEYVVLLTVKGVGKASYFTSEKQDAIETGREMIKHEEKKLNLEFPPISLPPAEE